MWKILYFDAENTVLDATLVFRPKNLFLGLKKPNMVVRLGVFFKNFIFFVFLTIF